MKHYDNLKDLIKVQQALYSVDVLADIDEVEEMWDKASCVASVQFLVVPDSEDKIIDIIERVYNIRDFYYYYEEKSVNDCLKEDYL